MTINQLLQQLAPTAPILQATFGLEREGLRVQQDGQLAQTPHPPAFGKRSFHPYIQTDFSEQQLELITPIASSTREARRFLQAITDVTYRTLPQKEQIWPLSMPPKLHSNEIHIAQLEDKAEVRYRQQLAEKYGKTIQAISGIHFNIELGADLMNALFAISGETDFITFKNNLYVKLAQNFLRFRWLLTYLYGASPLAEDGCLDKKPITWSRSLRNSSYGYVNKDGIHVSYETLEDYISAIEHYVEQGELSAEKEFYSPIRFRGQRSNRAYLTQGITYLECRCFDLDPFDPLGIQQETLDTIHLFLLALLWLDDCQDVTAELIKAQELNEKVALSHPLDPLPDAANPHELIEAMKQVVTHFKLSEDYTHLIKKIEEQLKTPRLTLAGQLLTHIKGDSLTTFAYQKASEYHTFAWCAPYALKGYEKMELSTQMLLFDAIQKGIHFEILDEEDQFLILWHQKHREYVKNGNMTAKDRYIVPLAMANKTVTKKILRQAGYPVPDEAAFSTIKEALAYYPSIQHRPIVVKPKSTNFGLGISIFQKPASLEAYQKALEIAFSNDDAVLVEEYIAGTEYRFFVLDGKCEAVLLRVAANVVGDGKHTISQLVQLKNAQPLRGSDHRAPLEKIQLGDIEQLMLKQQGYTAEDIVAKGTTVYLRRNSNISTGGDSIDMTEHMHDSYKKLAVEMAQAMGAWVCGVDLIIPDKEKISTSESPNCTCIELNFNPSMYMHTYCAEGTGQAITPKILAKLFPEVVEL